MNTNNNLRTPAEFDTPENEGKSQGPHTREAPICPLLRFYAQRHLRGGLETLVVLAGLSRDQGTRAVAKRWCALARKEKESVEVEEICQAAGVEYGTFFREIACTGWEVGIIVPLAFPIGEMTAFIAEAMRSVRVREQYWKAVALMHRAEPTLAPLEIPAATLTHDLRSHRGSSRRLCRGQRVYSEDEDQICNRFAESRRLWLLSQTQFADLFLTTKRSIRRWEEHRFCPAPTQQWFLELFTKYIQKNGRRAFLRRFVREGGRYRSPGRPSKQKSRRANANR